MTTPDQVPVQGREELRMDAAERAARDIAAAILCKGDEQIVLRLVPKHIRLIDQAARQDERRKVLRKVAQWHNDQAKGYENCGGGPQALNHRKYARHFVALAEEAT